MKELLSLLAFLPALLCGYQGMAQSSSSRFSLVVSPAIFIPVSVAAQGGIQYKANSRFSLLAEVAVPTFRPENTEYEELDYLRTGLELKYFVKKDSSLSKYISVQGNYLMREFRDEDQAFYYTKTQTFSYTNAIIKSPVLSTAIKIGTELNAGKRIFVDVFAGAGLRFVFTEYSAKNTLVTSTEPPKQSIFKFDDAWKYNYTLVRPHVTGGVRLGIRL